MHDVIAVLQRIGTDSNLRDLDVEPILATLDVELHPVIANALSEVLPGRLESILGARVNLVCSVAPGHEDDEDDADDVPDSDDDEIRAVATVLERRAA